VDKSRALLAEVFKLLGNSAYGKLIEALERQTNTIYTKDEKVVDRALRSAYFSGLEEVGQAYELESRKPRITIRRPFQVGIAVYRRPCINRFFFDGNGGFLADKACYLVVQSRNNFWRSFDPGSGPLALRESHFNGVLVLEQALSQGAVETFNNSLVVVNVNAPTPDICFVLVHLLCDSAHEFAPGVNLQHLRPFQRRALVNLLKGLGDLIRIFRSQGFGLFVATGHVDNGQRVFENFAPAGQFVVRQEKKVHLVYRVGCGNVEFRPRNSPRRREEYLPERLLEQPPFCGFFRYLGGFG